ncbi:hypothetical protein HKD42_05930 [Altererythrobacter sp. RZ02]|uniref:Peptidase M56 domain-containing protein n=1 Tax=Pontixanthobacter rizhaonensis TaxID=2730337 RepID=A0A848QLP6_9SPHN|nr:M56 family metallopeptidase [Pontixanthobacter rizhaonensis]NMW31593.1 hypothetical protein [Pontixanthobacter rizhaonensis]
MTDWLVDTLIWTAALIALVLFVRRPVARYFGPHVAYWLWMIPLVRLVVPPVVLPAWLAPEEAALAEAPLIAAGTMPEVTSVASEAPTALTGIAASAIGNQTIAETPFAAVDWAALAMGIWLIGVLMFLAVRFYYYFRMRSQLLLEARPVGQVDGVNLVETPDTNSPIAFGVIDRVVALPVGFMACTDKTERDLAIEHELSHHRAQDLLANVLVQPLFALHWFNPLGWYGWRAMRRDQEAACDARVIAMRGDADKAAYATVIASFAAGPDIALAAPMACPVIGEKSIIHRLRSLTMSDISPRRRTAGRVLLGAAVLALPLTASVSYAEALATAPPAPPAAPSVSMGGTPTPPAPPAPPPAPLAVQSAASSAVAPENETRVYVVDTAAEESDDKKTVKVINRTKSVYIQGDDNMTPEEREELLRELREELVDVRVEVKEAMKEAEVAIIELRDEGVTNISMECTDAGEAGETTDSDGKRVIRICKSKIMASALTGLKEARAALATNKELDEETRTEVLKALDEQIANWASEG